MRWPPCDPKTIINAYFNVVAEPGYIGDDAAQDRTETDGSITNCHWPERQLPTKRALSNADWAMSEHTITGNEYGTGTAELLGAAGRRLGKY